MGTWNDFIGWVVLMSGIPQEIVLETGSSSDKVIANQNVNHKLHLMMLLNSGRSFEIDYHFWDFGGNISIGVLRLNE